MWATGPQRERKAHGAVPFAAAARRSDPAPAARVNALRFPRVFRRRSRANDPGHFQGEPWTDPGPAAATFPRPRSRSQLRSGLGLWGRGRPRVWKELTRDDQAPFCVQKRKKEKKMFGNSEHVMVSSEEVSLVRLFSDTGTWFSWQISSSSSYKPCKKKKTVGTK